MTIDEALQKQIDEIMCWFDFNKVHKMMESINWTWGTEKLPPSEGEIRETALRLLKETGKYLKESSKKEDEIQISTGGFKVHGYKFTEEDKPYIYMEMFFGVSWDNEAIEYEEQ